MKNLSKTDARTLRHKELRLLTQRLTKNADEIETTDRETAKRVANDYLEFDRQYLHFEPFEYQRELIDLYQQFQFIAARWCRQSGKSWIASGLLLDDAVINNDFYIAVVGPSWRQTKLNIRRISMFERRLPKSMYLKPQKTKLEFPNGSVIEAFPNNADTIRGHTFDRVWWDEVNFTANDVDLMDAILFALGTTDGKLLATSTPFNSDSLFWKMCNHKDYSDFARHHVPYERVIAPNGPWSPSFLKKIKRQFGEDPMRWRREMEAEWAEDEDTWLSQSLITKCIGTSKSCGEELDLFRMGIDDSYDGNFYAGLDFAKHQDYSAFVLIEEIDKKYFLRYLKIWSHELPYASVIGWVKVIQDRVGEFRCLRADKTGVGDYIVEDMTNADIMNIEGVNFTLPRKQEMASLLKQRMVNKRFFFPYFTWEKPYRGNYVAELNVERFELRKDGNIAFNHPRGTHDDVFWATALALYATVEMSEESELVKAY